MTIEPKPGMFLYSSCRGENWGKIIAVHPDDNGTPCMDVELLDGQDCLTTTDDDSADFPNSNLMQLDIPEGTRLVLRDMQYRLRGCDCILVRSPGDGCFRCDKLLLLKEPKP